jgi:hypothetical protein
VNSVLKRRLAHCVQNSKTLLFLKKSSKKTFIYAGLRAPHQRRRGAIKNFFAELFFKKSDRLLLR